jgi:hypothetical protein
VTFSVSAPAVAVGIPDFARGPSNTESVYLPSTLTNGSTFALSYTNPFAHPTTGTATITFSSNPATLQANIQTALSSGGLAFQIGTNSAAGNAPNTAVVVSNDVSSGANVLITFQSALAQSTNLSLVSTTPGVSITAATINVANNVPGNGIPIALSSGLGATSGTFTLQYNPSLLNIIAGVSKIAGSSFRVVTSVTSPTVATAVITFASPTPISSKASSITIGSILATVPLTATASYGAKQLLHFSGIQLNGTAGPIAAAGADGVEVAAYFGDVSDTGGPLALADAVAMASVGGEVANTAAQTVPGFSAFPNLDPVIIGDVAYQGNINSTDSGAMMQQVAGQPRPLIPYAPIGLSVTPVGPDPTLIVDSGQWLVDSGRATVVVPVDIDTARPSGSTGMVDAMLALTYDPRVFDVSAADIQLGSVPTGGSGWRLNAEVSDQTGLIGVELYSTTPIQTAAAGSLVTIAMHLRDGAPSGSAGLQIVPYVDPTRGLRVYQTQVSDSQGAFVIHFGDDGQTAASSEQTQELTASLAIDNGQQPFAKNETVAESQPAVVQSSETRANVSNASRLVSPLLDRVFGDPEELASALLLVAPIGQLPNVFYLTQQDWLPDDCLAYLLQGTSTSLLPPLVTSLDGDAQSTDVVDAQPGGEVGAPVRNRRQL